MSRLHHRAQRVSALYEAGMAKERGDWSRVRLWLEIAAMDRSLEKAARFP